MCAFYCGYIDMSFCRTDFNGMVSRLVNMTNMNMDALAVESTTWGIQFRNALNVNGGNVETATTMDYVMHILTFGWKVGIDTSNHMENTWQVNSGECAMHVIQDMLWD